jgi:hypothetical protein
VRLSPGAVSSILALLENISIIVKLGVDVSMPGPSVPCRVIRNLECGYWNQEFGFNIFVAFSIQGIPLC